MVRGDFVDPSKDPNNEAMSRRPLSKTLPTMAADEETGIDEGIVEARRIAADFSESDDDVGFVPPLLGESFVAKKARDKLVAMRAKRSENSPGRSNPPSSTVPAASDTPAVRPRGASIREAQQDANKPQAAAVNRARGASIRLPASESQVAAVARARGASLRLVGADAQALLSTTAAAPQPTPRGAAQPTPRGAVQPTTTVASFRGPSTQVKPSVDFESSDEDEYEESEATDTDSDDDE